jgi:hypothetical protein
VVPTAGQTPLHQSQDVLAQFSPLMLLSELVSRMLVTMGDDEFYDDGKNGGGSKVADFVKLTQCLKVRNQSQTLTFTFSLLLLF